MAEAMPTDSRSSTSQNTDEEESKLCEKCIKLLSVLVVWIILIASLCSSQIFMFHLSMAFGQKSKSDSGNNATLSDEERVEATKIYLIVLFAAITPYLINFLRAIQITWGTRKNMPDWKMISLGLLSAILESVGVSILVFKVFPVYNGVACSLLLCCVSLVPLLSIFPSLQNRNWRFWVTVLTVMLQVTGTIFMIGWMVMVKEPSNRLRVIEPCVALLCLSFAWMPPLQKRSVQLRSEERNRTVVGARSWRIEDESESEWERSQSQNLENISEQTEAAWKMALISNVAKSVFVIIIAVVMCLVNSPIYPGGTPWNIIWNDFRLAWKWSWDDYDVKIFLLLIITCTIAHGVGLFLCQISKSMVLMFFPGYLSNVILVLALWNGHICYTFLPYTPKVCELTMYPEWAIIASTVALVLAAIFSLFVFRITREHILIRRESQVVWLPTFNSVAPGVWTVLNKRMWPWDREQHVALRHFKRAQIFVCTTMYREDVSEMSELIKSYRTINNMSNKSDAEASRYEFHIVLDDGAKDEEATKFALQLLSLMSSLLGTLCRDFTKVIQPYGLKLTWKPKAGSSFRYPITIHMKDNTKVKQKKRWSQIMYMEYIMNHIEARNDADRYILATDADVKFDGTSVETLVDFMTRDKTVGAVTGLTRPFNTGSGPCVWYQVFEYAMAHWLQKTAEHMQGSVLCASGCFSLFRCDALKMVLREYSSDVSCGFDVLTKDMGEDRWLSALLMEKGWTIEYCASSHNQTNCPDTFEDLYKQRRRWIVSNLANMLQLMRDYMNLIRRKRKEMMIGNVFLIYQGIVLWAFLISPSTIILVVAGGLQLSVGMDPIATIVLEVFVCLLYMMLCYCYNLSRKHQITIALFITLVYCVVMVGVAGGVIKTIVTELSNLNTPPDSFQLYGGTSNHTNGSSLHVQQANLYDQQAMFIETKVSATTVYACTLVGIFLLTSILHWDISSFVCGVFFFLFLPSGYLILMIYTFCNMTDRGWGTREEKKYAIGEKTLSQIMLKKLKQFGTLLAKLRQCFRKKNNEIDLLADDNVLLMVELATERFTDTKRNIPDEGVDLEEWLELEFKDELPRKCQHILESHGYENTIFLSHVEAETLEKIGIVNSSHRRLLMNAIDRLPICKVDVSKPTDVKEWLDGIGLKMYKSGRDLQPKDISDIHMPVDNVANLLKIKAQGHIDRLAYALNRVRYPDKDDVAVQNAKDEIELCTTVNVASYADETGVVGGDDAVAKAEEDPEEAKMDEAITMHGEETEEGGDRNENNVNEYKFWRNLINRCLDTKAESSCTKKQLNVDLVRQRKAWLILLSMSNLIWLIIIATLASYADLAMPGISAIGFLLLVMYLFLIATQFVAMLFHRGNTLIHRLARMSSFHPRNICRRSCCDENASHEATCCPCLHICCNRNRPGTRHVQIAEQEHLIQQ